jgi:hypothetical protein
MAMESRVLSITPNMAKVMLDKNMKNNRRLNHNTVKRYACIMKAGGWNLTHQGIAFDTLGQLIDGQHRLEAIVMANVPIKMMATYGVEHAYGEAFTIDTGTKRSTQNIMQISGIDDGVYKRMSSFVGAYMRMKIKYNSSQPEAAQIIAYIDRHYDDLKVIDDIIRGCASGGCKIHTIVAVAIIAAFYRGESEEALRRFVRVYRSNDVEHCEDYNPRHALNLRDWVRSHKSTPETLQRCECAIYSFAHNQTQMKICDRYPFQPTLDS